MTLKTSLNRGLIMRKSAALLLILAILLAFCMHVPFPVNADSRTLVVPDDYASIQEAINNAADGDTIFVKKGIYHENVVINKSLSLMGEDRDTTIVDGNPPEGYRIPIQIQSDNVSVSGFKVLYGWAGMTIGEVKYCSISENRIAGGTKGISAVRTSDSIIVDNIFELIGTSSAITLSYATTNLVKGNHIDSCVEGIQIWLNSNNNTIRENTITNCQDTAINFQYSNNNTIMRNTIINSGCGTSIYGSNNNIISNNNYVNNTIQFSAKEDYYLTFGHNKSVNTINENYWSDYNGTDANGDGVGDTPYIIDENNKDSRPLMKPVVISELLDGTGGRAGETVPFTVVPMAAAIFAVAITFAVVLGSFRKRGKKAVYKA